MSESRERRTTGPRAPGLQRRRWASWLAGLFLASSATALLPGSASAAGDAGVGAGNVSGDGFTAQIRRTEYGVPHILAYDHRGLGYGYGYAFAQDNACALADMMVTLRGERSRYFGPDTTPSSDAPETSNLLSDTYYRGLRQAGTVQRLLDRPAPVGPTARLREMVDGYAAGYNRYLRDTGVANLPDSTCRGKPWVRPITATDIWNIAYETNQMAGASAYADTIASATPPAAGSTPSAAVTKAPPALAALDASGRTDPEAGDIGSNGWALGRDATRDGNGMLLATPHLSWTGPGTRFYQVQLTIPGKLDVAGAGLYGTPVVEIGHTRSLAWTHTANSDQHATLYRLKLVPGDPTSYTIDGRTETMKRRTVRVAVRGDDGGLSTVSRTLYTSRYGPVLGFGWTGTTAYTLRDANADNLRSMDEWLAMGTSQNLARLRTAQSTYQGNPWTYTLAADTSGTAYFTDSSVVPHLTDDQLQRCTLPGGDDEPDALDGSTSACDWGSDPDAVVPGIVGPAAQPKLTRTDYVANSNNGPYFTNPASPMTGLPGVYRNSTELGLRAQLGLKMIEQRRDGRDGLGAPGFTLATLQASMLGDRNNSAELGRADVVEMCRAHPGLEAGDGTVVDVRTACDALDGWDGRDDADSRGAVVWSAFFVRLAGSGPGPWWRVPYDPAQPLTTPRGIDGDDPAVRRALADAVRYLAAEGIPADAPLGTAQRWAGVPLPGCRGGEGCFNVVRAGADSGSTGVIYPASPDHYAFGTSFVMAVELTANGPRTRTFLTYGQSADPDSPHYTDQTALFSRKQWVTERFTEAEIAADPSLRVTTLRR